MVKLSLGDNFIVVPVWVLTGFFMIYTLYRMIFPSQYTANTGHVSGLIIGAVTGSIICFTKTIRQQLKLSASS
jgi:membrane associated rhomboid family serine protease